MQWTGDSEVKHTIRDGHTAPTLNTSNNSLDWPREQNWPHLADLRLPNTTHGTVNFLLGADVFDVIEPREVVKGLPVREDSSGLDCPRPRPAADPGSRASISGELDTMPSSYGLGCAYPS